MSEILFHFVWRSGWLLTKRVTQFLPTGGGGRILAARSDKSVCHSSYVDDMGRKSATIKVKDPLNKGLLLDRAQLAVDRRCRVA